MTERPDPREIALLLERPARKAKPQIEKQIALVL